ncbi:MAG: tRNA uridine-5-carboxymethylaminomethyl(34) synthesis GTPase MnmE [Christensenellales bacterium]|jgi:tRNA modification GTPase
MNDTIYALATPLGNGVAVIRISGPQAEGAVCSLFSKKSGFESHKLYHGLILDGTAPVDDAMAVIMRAPKSYTGEDTAELHIHGSPAIAKKVLELLSSQGLRLAEPGEFTRRAFENGKLDLSQAEAVMDLVCAAAESQAKAALDQLRGSLKAPVTALQDELTDAIARAEAGIDYPEEDWEGEIADELIPALLRVKDSLRKLAEGGIQGRIIRDGLKVALCGRPNVGKSTLLNALLGENRAIVTALPGTTRDIIEERVDWMGLPVRLIDTAGLRSTGDEAEQIGIERARTAMQEADLALILFDGAQPFTEEDEEIAKEAKGLPALAVITKGDLPQIVTASEVSQKTGLEAVSVSALSPDGLDALKSAVYTFFESRTPAEKPDALVTNRRHLDAIQTALNAVDSAVLALSKQDLDCATIDLRRAWRALGEISGLTVDEAIVDRIFEKFCLGK